MFHDGDISPAVRLNMQLQQVLPEWPSGAPWPHNGYQNGNGGHSDWHLYEIDLGIISLSVTGLDDWLFVQAAMITNDNFGLVTDLGIQSSEDWGQLSSGIAGALQLGPLRRQLEHQKFNKQGGYSKKIGVDLGGGYTIENFKTEQISRYVTTKNEKTRIVMNSHISIV